MLKLSLHLARPRIAARRAIVLGAGCVLAAALAYIFLGANAHAVIEGRVYRSAQLSGESLASYLKSKRIRTVVNLRGHCPDMDWYAEETAVTAAAGVSQEDVTFSANRLPPTGELRRLIEVLDRTEYPVLLHCKQGADRTGLASAIMLLLYTDASLGQARRELWPHRGHFPVARTVAMDDFFDRYESWLKERGENHTPARFRDWALNHYQPGVAVAEYAWASPLPESFPAGKPIALTLRATNRSGEPWQFTPGLTAGLHLQYKLTDAKDAVVHDDVAGLLKRTVMPGESIDLLVALPALAPGRYALRAEMADYSGAGVAVRAKYFFQFGVEPLSAVLVVK